MSSATPHPTTTTERPPTTMSPPALHVSRSFLAHAVLAHISPELSSLDAIIALRSASLLRTDQPKTSIASLPAEILLLVRAFLLPALTDALLTQTTDAYADSLLARARRLCSECLEYNVQVYGPDALAWVSTRPGLQAHTDDAAGCECGTHKTVHGALVVAEWRNWEKLSASSTPAAPPSEHRDGLPNAFAKRMHHASSHRVSPHSEAWLESYLERRAGRGVPISTVLADVLAHDFGCAVTVAGSPKSDDPDAVALVPLQPPAAPFLPFSESDLLARVARELALLPTPNAGSELLLTARDMAASYIASCTSAPSRAPSKAAGASTKPVGDAMCAALGAGVALGAYTLAKYGVKALPPVVQYVLSPLFVHDF
ncbi:hypothetical protein OF83DRAFT_604766 [Amylostereum chailletii]|nr:hypothetical protein OF83DRAFT_604766 [Amylostereum chailletii]